MGPEQYHSSRAIALHAANPGLTIEVPNYKLNKLITSSIVESNFTDRHCQRQYIFDPQVNYSHTQINVLKGLHKAHGP